MGNKGKRGLEPLCCQVHGCLTAWIFPRREMQDMQNHPKWAKNWPIGGRNLSPRDLKLGQKPDPQNGRTHWNDWCRFYVGRDNRQVDKWSVSNSELVDIYLEGRLTWP